MRKPGDLWLPRVRAAIPRLAERFTAGDVCRALGATPDGTPRNLVMNALTKLADAGELEKNVVKVGTRRSQAYFTRTFRFREREFDFEAQRSAADFLQRLAVTWGNERNRKWCNGSSYAAAD